MPKNDDNQQLDWPKWRLPSSGLLLGVASLYLGIVSVVGLSWSEIADNRLQFFSSVIMGFGAIYGLLIAGPYTFQWIKVLGGRLDSYDHLVGRIAILSRDLERSEQAVKSLTEKLSEGTLFELRKVLLHDHHLYVVVQKRSDAPLQIGSWLAVVDQRDYRLMGEFVITEERSDVYYAIEKNVDPLWLGVAHGAGAYEQYPLPHTIAISIQMGEGNHGNW